MKPPLMKPSQSPGMPYTNLKSTMSGIDGSVGRYEEQPTELKERLEGTPGSCRTAL